MGIAFSKGILFSLRDFKSDSLTKYIFLNVLSFIMRNTSTNLSKRLDLYLYDSFSDVGEIRVYWRADFQSGSRVLKKGVLNPFLSISMAYNVISCQKVAENTQSLNSLCKSGSRPQKSPKKSQKTDHSIAIYSNF